MSIEHFSSDIENGLRSAAENWAHYEIEAYEVDQSRARITTYLILGLVSGCNRDLLLYHISSGQSLLYVSEIFSVGFLLMSRDLRRQRAERRRGKLYRIISRVEKS